jgi:hypothetical protein
LSLSKYAYAENYHILTDGQFSQRPNLSIFC